MDVILGIKLVVAAIIPLALGLTVPQVVKAWTARKMGDRYTLRSYNPLDYIDKIGTLGLPLLIIFITQSLMLFGWSKQSLVNVSNIRDKKDRVIVYLSGPIANLIMVLLWAIVAVLITVVQKSNYAISGLPLWDMLALMAKSGIQLNILFMAFSLFPLLPFDGGKIVDEFLPVKASIGYRKLEPYAMYIMLFIVFFTGIISFWVGSIGYLVENVIIAPLVYLLN